MGRLDITSDPTIRFAGLRRVRFSPPPRQIHARSFPLQLRALHAATSFLPRGQPNGEVVAVERGRYRHVTEEERRKGRKTTRLACAGIRGTRTLYESALKFSVSRVSSMLNLIFGALRPRVTCSSRFMSHAKLNPVSYLYVM